MTRFLATIAVILAAASPAVAQVIPTGSWSAEASGELYLEGEMVTDGTYSYLVGGFQGGVEFPLNRMLLRRYDPAANSWVTLQSMPVGVFMHAAAHHGGRIYSFGGALLAEPVHTRTDIIQAYTISENTWVTLNGRLREPRNQMMAATMGDLIYMVGGSPDWDEFNGVTFAFDPATESVTARASLPPRLGWNSTLTAVPGLNRLYVIGGSDSLTLSTQINYEYNPQADAWTGKTFIRDTDGSSQPCHNAGTFEFRNRVYVVGGDAGDGTAEPQTFEYTPWRDRWVRRASMNIGRTRHGAVAMGGRGYVYGGNGLFGLAFASGEEFTPPILNDAPIPNAGPDQTLECTSASGAEATLDGTRSADYDPGDSITYVWTGSFGTQPGVSPTVSLPLGTHTVTLTVTDAAGASATDTVVITVQDTTAPTLESLTSSEVTLTPPNHKMRAVELSVTATDIADPDPVSEILSVTSNQDQGDEPDWEITGALTLNLRAERSGGEDRIYTITVRCIDASGNSSTAQVTVTVPH